MANKDKKAMVTNASKTLRNPRSSKISKQLAGSVLAKSKFKREKKQATKQKQQAKNNRKKGGKNE